MSEDRETRTLENKENNAPENTKIKKTKNKSAGILAGEVTAWIVLVLSVISLCFRVFHVNLPSITPVVEMIEDSSGVLKNFH